MTSYWLTCPQRDIWWASTAMENLLLPPPSQRSLSMRRDVWWCYHSLLSQHLSVGSGFDERSVRDSLGVNASFQQTLWSVAPIYSGGGVAQGRLLQTVIQMLPLFPNGVTVTWECCETDGIIIVLESSWALHLCVLLLQDTWRAETHFGCTTATAMHVWPSPLQSRERSHRSEPSTPAFAHSWRLLSSCCGVFLGWCIMKADRSPAMPAPSGGWRCYRLCKCCV